MNTNDQNLNDHSLQMNDSMAVGALGREYQTAAKMFTTDPKEAQALTEDPKVIGRVKHVMKSKEKLMQFYARTGLGKAQIMKMSRWEISAFVERVTKNAANEPGPILSVWEQAPLPKKFSINMIDTYADTNSY